MANNDISLHGVRNYAETKECIPSNLLYGDLKDLEITINKMNAIRNGSSTENCSCHGNEVPSEYGESMTICNSHVFIYNSNNLSVGHINDVVDNLKFCSCDSHEKMYCDCHTYKDICNCDSYY